MIQRVPANLPELWGAKAGERTPVLIVVLEW
jgi:hypothetical protein